MGTVCGASLFGNGFNYIKVGNGEIVAIEGSNTAEKLTLSDLRMPYKQLLKSRISLKAGQTNYLLNFLGLGDNATFLAMKIIYDPKSKKESENFINWSFYDDLTTINTIGQLMILTGNSTNRIKQIYLTNPSTKYPVSIEIMIGVIDEESSFFNDTLNQSGTSFVNLEWTDIKSHILGETIVVNDNGTPVRPLIYLILNNIQSIAKSGNIIIIDDTSLGSVFLQFKTTFDVNQAYSLLNYILENPSINFDNISADELAPIIYWNEFVFGTNDYITLNGATAGAPYNTNDGSNSVQTFIVTVQPVNGINRYFINGVERPVLNLVRGGVYTFDQSDLSNTTHPLRFRVGGVNSVQFIEGVVPLGTPGQAGAEVVFTVPNNAPSTLQYYCTNHPLTMGNDIIITSVELTFSTTIGLTSSLDANSLIDLLVDYSEDNRDGLIILDKNNLVINDGVNDINEITATGSYQVTFTVSDLATNELNTIMNINIV